MNNIKILRIKSKQGPSWKKITPEEVAYCDHISYKIVSNSYLRPSYWQHILVVNTSPLEGIYWRFYNQDGNLTPTVVQEKLTFEANTELQRADYHGKCYSPFMSVNFAKVFLGYTDYSSMTRSAGGFVRYLKTGYGGFTFYPPIFRPNIAVTRWEKKKVKDLKEGEHFYDPKEGSGIVSSVITDRNFLNKIYQDRQNYIVEKPVTTVSMEEDVHVAVYTYHNIDHKAVKVCAVKLKEEEVYHAGSTEMFPI